LKNTIIPGDNVRQQLDKNSVHNKSPEETGEPCCHFFQSPGELQSSGKISEGQTILVIFTRMLTMALSTQIYFIIPFLSSTSAFVVFIEQASLPLW
jgi:hypothetical protein